MLGLLRNALADRNAAAAVRREPGTAPSLDFVTLDHPDTILRLLNQMHYSRSKVSLHAETAAGVVVLHSTIARVQRKERGIVLHRPQPDWQRLVPAGAEVEVICFLNSGQLSFFSRLWPLDEGQDLQFCTLTLPAQVTKFQLRSAFRVFLPPASSRARLVFGGAATGLPLHTVDAAVLDLSLDGCGLRLDADALPLLQAQTELREIHVSLMQGQLEFTTAARVCRADRLPGGHALAGLQFLPLPDATARSLQTLLTDVQRQQLRRQVQLF